MAFFPGFSTAFVIAVAKAVAGLKTALANRQAAKRLLEWDDRALKDIGLTRSDVRGAVSLPIAEDPTEFLSLIAAGREVRYGTTPRFLAVFGLGSLDELPRLGDATQV